MPDVTGAVATVAPDAIASIAAPMPDGITDWGGGVGADATTVGRLCSTAIRPLSERRVSFEIALSVSKTPVPFVAEDS